MKENQFFALIAVFNISLTKRMLGSYLQFLFLVNHIDGTNQENNRKEHQGYKDFDFVVL